MSRVKCPNSRNRPRRKMLKSTGSREKSTGNRESYKH